MAMFSDARRAKKDVLADLVALKHDVQTCISKSSLRKAFLNASEDDVRSDMQMIIDRLYTLVKAIHDNAKIETTKAVKVEREKVNDEIIYLEDLHKSLDDMEGYVRTNTSNTNMKPLKIGKDKCESTRASLEQFKANMSPRSAKFILHPILTQILEGMENFSLGQTVVMEADSALLDDSVIDEEPDFVDEEIGINLERDNTRDPLRTSFIRSNSSKLIKLPEKTTNASSRQISRANSVMSSKGGDTPRQNSRIGGATGSKANQSQANSRMGASKKAVSRQNSMVESISGSKTTKPTIEKKSKLINKRSKSNDTTMQRPNQENDQIELDDEGPYRAIVGLRATLTQRSASAPLINLTSKKKGMFMPPIREEPPSPFHIKFRENMESKKHATGCYITGIAAFPNGSVVICDGVHDSLQLFDPQLQAISEMECNHPWGICTVSDTAVAVSLHYSRKIILVKAVKELEKINEKDIILKCNAALIYDLKFYAYRLYVLCIDGDIHVLDLKGREFKVIKTNMPQNTLRFFDVDVERDMVVVAGEKGIAALSKGIPVWKFKTSGKPKTVCTGIILDRGGVLVCDWENNRVAELYDDGQKLRTLISENLVRPVVISLVKDTGLLLVSQGDYDMEPQKTRMIKVMHLEKKDEVE